MERTIEYRPGELLSGLHRRRGPVVTVGRPGRGYAYLLGPEANQFVLASSQLFTWRGAFDWLVPVDGATSMLLSDGPDHRRRRTLVQPALHHRQVDHYLGTMADCVDAVIDTWRPGQKVDLYAQLRVAVRRATLRTLFGERLADDAGFFGEHLQTLLDLCGGLPQQVAVHRRLRTGRWRRAMLARSRVDERVHAEIARARAEPGDSVLDTLVHGRDSEGSGLTDEEIRDQVVTLIVAGYETTSATLAWAGYGLLNTPGVLQSAQREVGDVLGDRPPGREDLPRMPYLDGVVREALRLYPAVTVIGRRVAEDFEHAGRTIRSGTMAVISPYVTHRMPELWPDALRFRPDRWQDPVRGKPAPHEFLPFGGGPHRCVGATMATAELTVMLARLVARVSLELPPQRVRATGMISLRPANGLSATVLDVHAGR